MIRSFVCELTEDIWRGRTVRRLPPDIQRTARRKLRYLDSADKVHQLREPPGNRLEMLKGEYNGYYSIRINDQWRILFRFDSGDAYEVQIIDYH